LEAGPEARPTQPSHPQRIADAEDLELYGSSDTVNIEDILSVDMTPLSSISTSTPDMSVAMSVDRGTLMTVDFDDRGREIQDTAATMLELADTTAMAGASSRFRNPSLALNVGRANIGESLPGTHPLTAQGRVSLGDTASGTHPPTAQGYTSLGDIASGMIPSMALGRYTDSDDIAEDRFWTSTVRSHDVDSFSDLSIPVFDTRSEYDRYFAEIGTRRDSAVASAGTQVGPSPWTLATPSSTEGVPRSSSDPSLVPPQ